MRQEILTIIKNEPLTHDIFRMKLAGNTSAITAPGQFINIKLDGFFLRRPISVCDWDDGEVSIIYKVLGRGTGAMTNFSVGKQLDVLTGLGNGYDTSKSGCSPLLVGGGVGIPPLYGLARRLLAEGRHPLAVLGFNTAEDQFLVREFEEMGISCILTSADGTLGTKGFVTDGMVQADDYTYLYTCGPEAMLKAVYAACRTSGQFSFEERMGCGFGACMGCSCKTKYGTKRICKDGPVLEKEEIIW